MLNCKRLRKEKVMGQSLDSRDSEILYEILYLYLYDDGLHQAQPLMVVVVIVVVAAAAVLVI